MPLSQYGRPATVCYASMARMRSIAPRALLTSLYGPAPLPPHNSLCRTPCPAICSGVFLPCHPPHYTNLGPITCPHRFLAGWPANYCMRCRPPRTISGILACLESAAKPPRRAAGNLAVHTAPPCCDAVGRALRLGVDSQAPGGQVRIPVPRPSHSATRDSAQMSTT